MSKGVAVYRQRFAFPLLSREEQGIITYTVNDFSSKLSPNVIRFLSLEICRLTR